MRLTKVTFLMIACLLAVFFIITSCAGNPITPNTPGTDIIVATGSEGLLIFDISDPTNPTLLSDMFWGELINLTGY